MSHARVRKLFSAALAEWAAVENVPVSYDNVVKSFDANENHIESHLIPADTFSDTLAGDHKAFIGIFQLRVVTKYGQGMLDAESYIESLQNVFQINKTFTDDTGFMVQVTNPIVVPEGKQVGSQLTIPAYFSYRADTN